MTILTVTQINTLVRGNLERDSALQNICVRGEISNFKVHSSGHVYFSLKDAASTVKCVMYRTAARQLRFRPADGMAVLAAGRVSVYLQGGYYQLVCGFLQPDGAGDLHLAFEQMKEKLAREGLFDEAHKKPLPPFPHRVAIVTSPTGDALQDMLRILSARYPLSRVILLPVRVQGEGAAEEISRAIRLADRHCLADVLIVGRGGGSAEDLWPFNEEIVARAIYDCRIPVVSAVGHEPDVSISDYVADLRAATPSNAAELIAPDQKDLRRRIQALGDSFAASMQQRLMRCRQELTSLSAAPMLRSPMDYVQEQRMRLDLLKERISGAQHRILKEKTRQFTGLAASLDAMSPLKVLGRGYSFAQDRQGTIVRSVTQIRPGQALRLRFADGAAQVTVNNLEDTGNEPNIPIV